jgi:hypothetical protein
VVRHSVSQSRHGVSCHSFPKQEITFPQVGFRRIVGYVLLKILELFSVPDQMIEGFALPEGFIAIQALIDFASRETQPTGALLSAGRRRPELDQHVYVIRHYDEAVQVISLAVEVKERIADDRR